MAWNAPIVLNGALLPSGGTSLAAPCWAGIWALVQAYHDATDGVGFTGRRAPGPVPVANATGPVPEVLSVFLDQSFGSPDPFQLPIGFAPKVAHLVPDVAVLYTPLPDGS